MPCTKESDNLHILSIKRHTTCELDATGFFIVTLYSKYTPTVMLEWHISAHLSDFNQKFWQMDSSVGSPVGSPMYSCKGSVTYILTKWLPQLIYNATYILSTAHPLLCL